MSLDDVFLSSGLQPASTWLSLLGTLSSLAHLVPGGLPPHASPPTHCTSLVGSPGDFLSGLLVVRMPPRSSLVDGPRMSSSGGGGCLYLNSHPTSTSGPTRQTSAGVLTSVTKSFQASGLRKRLLFLKSWGEGSPPFSLLHQPFHGRGVCRQLRSRGFSSQRRGHSISGPHCRSPAYPTMIRTPTCSPGSPVHHGKSQCSGRLSLPNQSKGWSGLFTWKSFWSSAASVR